ncbi:PQQ-binding-like beta-propeller repeat protein [Steroidobacter cummioxidans]|uniref:outer membrane protein assembly factor BamB family protein n=1 Tax=Steroidobacter cummioxidans TaxID=1803913 RepID=UPI000E30F10B|nr:PQQ-binding-like beta-propeller repeat protein [Steroidobacter cummioxidans]
MIVRLGIGLICLTNAIALQAQPATLAFSDLAGWWSADPVYAGESSRVVLQFSEKDGKPVAELSLPAIGAYAISLGTVILDGNRIDTKPLSFPLTWNPDSRTLSGVLPHDAVPVYDIAVEFHRGEPVAKPEPMQWKGKQPKVKWSVQLGAAAWAGLERDAQSGLLFVGNEQGVLNAVDASGSIRWKFPTEKAIRGRPAVIGESVYVTSDSGFLYQLNKHTGAEKWRARIDAGSPERLPTDQEKSRWDQYGSSVVADAQRLYVASRDNNLYALDPENGREIWRVTAGDMMTATPAVYRDLVLFAAFDGKVQAVSARDGKVRWTYDAKLAVPGDLVISGDRVLLGSRTYDLIALDAASGKEQWRRYYWFSWIESTPVVRDGFVYTGSSDAVSVYAIKVADGSLHWKTPVPGWSWSRTAVNDKFVVAGTVGVGPLPGSRSGALVALERGSGAVRWLYQEEPSKDVIDAKKNWGFGASPLIVDDTVYAVDLKGRLYAFELGS